MEFGFSSDQEQLKAQVRRFLDTECPMDRVRTIMTSKEPHDAGLWKKMAELGWQALTIPEEFGGLGRSWVRVPRLPPRVPRYANRPSGPA